MQHKEEEEEKNLNKKEYQPPVIKISFIEMEYGIAAGSAITTPSNDNGQVKEEWETEDDSRPFEW
ncbi:hypothetical protein [Elizabethkingia meningoseptica]|uniref:hypothetical protein n=1 Tax=Elizabethkingia meningoseptica TaxID=238 RepID=UPI002DD6904B|nr:hypothetical protein [Elizabethkingia meningoseptica]MEC4711968.1 hypothetical protein [Elizabethkingia meningoseptica]